MSFSFRNLFNQEGEIPSDEAASANTKISNQSEGPFSADRGSNAERGLGKSAEHSDSIQHSQSFTIGELLAFIPPAISAQSGLSLDETVNIPVLENETSEVKLSTLYQVCPNLFAAEITPLNDSVVPLPSREDDSSKQDFQTPEFCQPPQGNPFADAFTNPVAPSFSNQDQETNPQRFTTSAPEPQNPDMADTQTGVNPFWSQVESPLQPESEKPESEVSLQGNSIGSSDPLPDKASFGSSFPSEMDPNQSTSPSQNHSDPVSDSFSGKGTTPPEMEGFAPAESNEMIGNLFPPNLGKALNQTGMDQTEVIQSTLPEAEKENVIKKESAPVPDETEGFLEKGNPFLPDSSSSQNKNVPNQFDNGPDFSTLFTKEAASDAEITSDTKMPAPTEIGALENAPDNEIPGPATPSETPEPSSEFAPGKESIFGSPSEKPFEPPKADYPEEDDLSAFIPPTPEEQTIPDIPALREAEEPEYHTDPIASDNQALGSDSNSSVIDEPPGFADTISSFPPFETANVDNESTIAPVPDDSFSGTPSGPDLSEELPANLPGQPLEEENHSADLPTDPGPSPGTTPPLKDEIINNVELRAVFGTDESFTLRKIATLIVCMPGVTACAISTPKKSLQASRDKEATIGEESTTLAKTVRKLADLTGSPNAQSFTVNTDKGILSIFVGGESYITVQHDPGGFRPGVQEKLILVAGSLDGVEE